MSDELKDTVCLRMSPRMEEAIVAQIHKLPEIVVKPDEPGVASFLGVIACCN